MHRPNAKGFYKHGNLPHLDVEGALQFITFALADTAPTGQQPRKAAVRKDNGDAVFIRVDNVLDHNFGSCILKSSDHARSVIKAIRHAEYRMHIPLAWVVMPNHVHLLFRQLPGSSLGRIVQSIKAGSAKLINESRGGQGTIWQRGYFDRMIRDTQHLEYVIDYIHENPVKAGLATIACNWQHGTAATFQVADIERALSYRSEEIPTEED